MARFGQNGSIPSTIDNGEGGACTWTKVLLDENYRHAGYKSRVLRKALNSGYLHVPNSHSCEQVIAAFLRHLLDSMGDFLQRLPGYGKQPVEYWFTIPGVYSGAARARMSSAIQNAGYGNRPQDSVNLLTEGEAAAVAVQHLLPNAQVGLPACPYLFFVFSVPCLFRDIHDNSHSAFVGYSISHSLTVL